jgi:hypothetical protein
MTAQAGVRAQHFEALEKANRIRCGHARFRRELKKMFRPEALERCARILVGEEDFKWLGIQLDYLLRSCPRLGTETARNIVWDAGLNPGRLTTRLESLTNVERAQLARVLRKRAQKK